MNPTNDAPEATNDTYNVTEDTALVIDAASGVLANDTDIDGDTLTVSAFTNPANGSLTLNADGSFTYIPNANYEGTDNFTYTVSDGNGGTDTATVNLAVGNTNDVPTANDDALSTDEDSALNFSAASLIANDTDADGDTLTIQSFTQPANGAIVDHGNGTYTYTPDANFNGTDTFSYTISDGNGGTATADVDITVNAVEDAPVANDDNYSVNEDGTLNVIVPGVLGNDTDHDGDALTIDSFTNPANGSLTLNADGSFTYTPNADYNGSDNFTYTVTDGNGNVDNATVNITVNPTNDAPEATNDTYNVTEDTALVIDAASGVLANDTDIDGDTLTVSAFTNPANGSLTLNADGSFTYIPNANYEGTDNFTYTVSDGNGGTDTATVNLAVGNINDVPTANDDALSTDEDSALNFSAASLIANDTDADGDTLTIQSFTQPANGAIVDHGNGTYTYTPDANFNGTDTFSYTISDGNGGTATADVDITVNAVEDAPVANDDNYSVNEDGTLNVIVPGVLGNDTDHDGDALTIDSFTNPANGSLTLNADGSFTYTPNADYNGSDNFTYTVTDGNGNVDNATVNITVNPTNDAPEATNDTYNVTEDTALVIDAASGVLANDTDIDGDTLTVSAFTNPANGSLTLNADGSFTYIPNANYEGTDNFTYTVSDGNGGTDTATVNLAVGNINDVPTANDDALSTDEDSALNFSAASLIANDTDADGDTLTIQSFTQPANGAIVDHGNGTYTYTPDANFNGTDTFSYTISDGNGGTATADVDITVNAVEDAPVANDDNYSVAEDTTLNVVIPGVLGNDTDDDGDALTVDSFTNPANGSLTLNADGSFTYTPNADYNGSDNFTYTVTDGNGNVDNATVNITVNPTNDAPEATNDTYNVTEDTALVIDALNGVLANDSDIDGDTLTVSAFTNPANGSLTLNADGSFTYIPNANYEGTDNFTYTVSDGNGGTDTATVNLAVGNTNDVPTANDDVLSTDEDSALNFSAASLIANDTDADGDTLTIQSFTQPANGAIVDHGNGTYTYTPDANFNGTDTFSYTISDGNGGTATADVDITVNAVEDAPVANDDNYSVAEDGTLNVIVPGVLGNDTDHDGDALTIDSFTNPANGSLTLNAYTPDANF